MKAKRKRSYWRQASGTRFGASCAKAGRLAVLGQQEKALAVVKTALGQHRGRPQQYQLLCQGGGYLFSLGRHDEAKRVFQEALEAAYEPAAALAKIGLAKCLLVKGDWRAARNEIVSSIREAARAAKVGYSQDAEGAWTLSAIPLYAQGIAMRIYPAFAGSGKADVGLAVLQEALKVGGGSCFRLKLLLGKLNERAGKRREALQTYDEALSPSMLGPRALPALAGWCRSTPTRDPEAVRQKLSGFRNRLTDRAVLTACLNLRQVGRGAWKDIVAMPLPKQDKVAAAAALQLRILMLSNRGEWEGVVESAEELLSIPGLTAQESAGAVAAGAAGQWHLGTSAFESMVNKAVNKNDARWALHKRLLDLGDGELAEAFFKSRMAGSGAALFNYGKALALQDKTSEAQAAFRKIVERKQNNAKVDNAALAELIVPLSIAFGPPDDAWDLLRKRVNKLAEDETTSSIFGLAGLSAKLARRPGGRNFAKVPLEEARDIFQNVFLGVTDPRMAVALLNSMNEALESNQGRGGVRDLYTTTAEDCLPMLRKGGEGYFRYITSVYEATYSSGLVVEAESLWNNATRNMAIPAKWVAAKMVEEGTRRIFNRQASGIELVHRAYSRFGTGPFAAKACYYLSLHDLGQGDFRRSRSWAAAGLDSLGGEITADKTAWLRARLEVVASGLNRRATGKEWRKWKGRYRWKGTLERVMRDLAAVEAPTSA